MAWFHIHSSVFVISCAFLESAYFHSGSTTEHILCTLTKYVGQVQERLWLSGQTTMQLISSVTSNFPTRQRCCSPVALLYNRCLRYCWLGSKLRKYADATKPYKLIVNYRVKEMCQIIFLWHCLPPHQKKAPPSLTEASLNSATSGCLPPFLFACARIDCELHSGNRTRLVQKGQLLDNGLLK